MHHDATDSDQSRKRSGLRAWHWLLVAFGLFMMTLLCGAIWLASRDMWASRKVSDKLKQLRASGLPTDNTSLNEYYERLTTRENVDRWLRLLAQLKSPEFHRMLAQLYSSDSDEAPSMDPAQAWPQEPSARAWLRQHADLRREAHELAAQGQRVRFPIKFDGFNTQLEPLSEMRQVARLFHLEALVALRNRDSRGATEAILATLGVSQTLEGQPLLVGQLVSVAIQGMAIEQIKLAVENNVLNQVDLQRIIDRLQMRTAWSWRWQVAISGERAAAIPTFQDPRRYLDNSRSPGISMPWRSHDILSFLSMHDQALELSTDDVNQFLAGAEKLEQQASAQLHSSNLLSRFDNVVTEMIMPAFLSLAGAFVQAEMQARLAITGLGLRLFQKRHGRWPDTLEQLSEVELKPDQLRPLGNQPFGYRPTGNQVTLWGFRYQDDTSTPAEPPDLLTNPGWNEIWVWNLK